jgi:hypothetical protein
MTLITPVILRDGTSIYIEATENLNIASGNHFSPKTEAAETAIEDDLGLHPKGWSNDLSQSQPTIQDFQAIEATIRAYTNYTLNAFKKVANANIEKVTLEFGLRLGTEAGIPYITQGTTDSNIKIKVECSFPDKNANQSER